MANYQPPPTYADVVVIDEKTQKARFNPIWLKWFIELAGQLGDSGLGASSTPNHENLSGLQGGASGDHSHFTAAEKVPLVAGFTGAGNIARATSPAFTTPAIGAATGTSLVLTGGGVTIGVGTLLTSNVALTNGAAAAGGTLLNAPAAGNPTKWVPINDNGTTRYIPAW